MSQNWDCKDKNTGSAGGWEMRRGEATIGAQKGRRGGGETQWWQKGWVQSPSGVKGGQIQPAQPSGKLLRKTQPNFRLGPLLFQSQFASGWHLSCHNINRNSRRQNTVWAPFGRLRTWLLVLLLLQAYKKRNLDVEMCLMVWKRTISISLLSLATWIFRDNPILLRGNILRWCRINAL